MGPTRGSPENTQVHEWTKNGYGRFKRKQTTMAKKRNNDGQEDLDPSPPKSRGRERDIVRRGRSVVWDARTSPLSGGIAGGGCPPHVPLSGGNVHADRQGPRVAARATEDIESQMTSPAGTMARGTLVRNWHVVLVGWEIRGPTKSQLKTPASSSAGEEHPQAPPAGSRAGKNICVVPSSASCEPSRIPRDERRRGSTQRRYESRCNPHTNKHTNGAPAPGVT